MIKLHISMYVVMSLSPDGGLVQSLSSSAVQREEGERERDRQREGLRERQRKRAREGLRESREREREM